MGAALKGVLLDPGLSRLKPGKGCSLEVTVTLMWVLITGALLVITSRSGRASRVDRRFVELDVAHPIARCECPGDASLHPARDFSLLNTSRRPAPHLL